MTLGDFCNTVEIAHAQFDFPLNNVTLAFTVSGYTVLQKFPITFSPQSHGSSDDHSKHRDMFIAVNRLIGPALGREARQSLRGVT